MDGWQLSGTVLSGLLLFVVGCIVGHTGGHAGRVAAVRAAYAEGWTNGWRSGAQTVGNHQVRMWTEAQPARSWARRTEGKRNA